MASVNVENCVRVCVCAGICCPISCVSYSVCPSVWAGVPLRLELLAAVRFALQIDFQ